MDFLSTATPDAIPTWTSEPITAGQEVTSQVEATDFTSLPQVIYSSETERILTIVTTVILVVLSLVGQSAVMITIIKNEVLHTVDFIVIFGNCIGDIVIIAICSPFFLTLLIMNEAPILACQVLSCIGIGTVFGEILLLYCF